MQLFPCRLCGLRPETEFRYLSEAGTDRPEPSDNVSAAEWSAYLHTERNPRGPAREIWCHVPCGTISIIERDTATGAVSGATDPRAAP